MRHEGTVIPLTLTLLLCVVEGKSGTISATVSRPALDDFGSLDTLLSLGWTEVGARCRAWRVCRVQGYLAGPVDDDFPYYS